MENLEELLDIENMNKFLDEMFEGVPKDYAANIFFNLIYPARQQGMIGEPPIMNFELNEHTGLTNEQKGKALKSMKKVYSFGYALGIYANGLVGISSVSGTKKEISLDTLTLAMDKVTQIVRNAVYYFNPEGIEDFIDETNSDLADIINYGQVLRKENKETIH